MNINNYLKKYNNTPFTELAFNELDSLILSELSYMNLDMYVPSLEDNKFINLSRMRIRDQKAFSYGSVDYKNNLKMVELMKSGNRFKHIKVGLYKSNVNEKDSKESQFFAVTFVLPNGDMYIAFRGTDITINGWKEDFHMAFMDTIPSQTDALAYTKAVLKKYNNPFYIGGHSKGGNLAFYSALNLDNEEYENRLIKAYSFDGPGFKDGVRKFPSYNNVKGKLVKYMTNRDWVGMVYNNFRKNAIIVSATGFLLGGHDPFTWLVNVPKFRFIRGRRLQVYKNSEVAFNEWLKSVSEEDKVLACDIIFDLLQDCKTVYDLPKALGTIIFHGKEIMGAYSDEEKDRVLGIVKRLIKQFIEINLNTESRPKRIASKA